MIHFGNYIRDQRRLQGITQHELARLIGIPDRKMDDIELSAQRPAENLLFAQLAQALGFENSRGLEYATDERIRLVMTDEGTAAAKKSK